MKLLWIILLIVAVIITIVYAFRKLIEMLYVAVRLSIIAKKLRLSSTEEDKMLIDEKNEKDVSDTLS